MRDRQREEIVEKIATGVKKLRIENSISQDQLAMEMRLRGEDWHQTTVSRVEAGYREVSMIEMMSLLQVFDCALDDIVPNEETERVERGNWELSIGIFDVTVSERDRLVERIHNVIGGIDVVSTIAPMEIVGTGE